MQLLATVEFVPQMKNVTGAVRVKFCNERGVYDHTMGPTWLTEEWWNAHMPANITFREFVDSGVHVVSAAVGMFAGLLPTYDEILCAHGAM